MMQELLTRYPNLSDCRSSIEDAAQEMIRCYEYGGKILLCGNGGSCADCDHIVGELMKGFLKKRPLPADVLSDLDDSLRGKLQQGLPAISLCSITALNTAFCNDVDPALIYAQSTLALGKKGDTLIAISTSGNAANVASAAKVAKSLGMRVIALTGIGGGTLAGLADICIRVPESETFKVQELHLPVYHYLCAAVEHHFFSK